jgi:hypothetical protein
MMSKRKTVIVYTAACARQLLKLGYQIVDVKPDKFDEDGKRSIFVFKNEDGKRSIFVFKNEDGLEEIIKRFSTKR